MNSDGASRRPFPQPRRESIGKRVRVQIDDGFVEPGLTGLVVNVIATTVSVRVNWDNDTISIVKQDSVEQLGWVHQPPRHRTAGTGASAHGQGDLQTAVGQLTPKPPPRIGSLPLRSPSLPDHSRCGEATVISAGRQVCAACFGLLP